MKITREWLRTLAQFNLWAAKNKPKKTDISELRNKIQENLMKPVDGAHMIKVLTEEVEISTSMLAGMMNITERKLLSWSESDKETLHAGIFDPKSPRLVHVYEAFRRAKKLGIPPGQFLSFLHEPMIDSGEEEDRPSLITLLCYPEDTAEVLTELAVQRWNR